MSPFPPSIFWAVSVASFKHQSLEFKWGRSYYAQRGTGTKVWSGGGSYHIQRGTDTKAWSLRDALPRSEGHKHRSSEQRRARMGTGSAAQSREAWRGTSSAAQRGAGTEVHSRGRLSHAWRGAQTEAQSLRGVLPCSEGHGH